MWEIDISSQIIAFLHSLVFGVAAGLLFDIPRSTRTLVTRKKLFIFITDLFFWVFCAVALFCFLLVRTNGELRGFVLLGALIGFLAERFIISPIVVKFLKKIIQLCFNILKKIFAIKNRILDNISAFFISFMEKSANILKKDIKSAKKP